MPRSMHNRGHGDSRKAVQQPARGRTARGASNTDVTRVTRETEVRGKETRVESVVERAAKPTVSANRTDRGRYVYCIIRASAPLKFGAIGMDEEWADVYTINYKDMAAVVSDVPMTPLDSTRENVLAHERVNETVMREHTVIPMSFGTIFKTREDILELLRSAYEAFADVLNKMQDKLEFGLKVLWDRDLIIREIEEEDEDIRRLKGEISSQKGSTYFARMQYGRLIDAALQARSERYVAEIFQALRDVSVASRSNKPIGDRMIMNAALLVARDLEQAFDAGVKDIGQRYDKLTFKYTGPWPPYNFVNTRLKLERAH
jgi:Gas vesicle synthesis protein GvpL/GvpF